MNKQKLFKTITLNIKNVVKFIDTEKIKALNLNGATKLVSDIQIAECKQANESCPKELEIYKVLFAQKIGLVQGEKDFITLVVGEDNEWYQYINSNVEWNSIIELEWEDYINEVLDELN